MQSNRLLHIDIHPLPLVHNTYTAYILVQTLFLSLSLPLFLSFFLVYIQLATTIFISLLILLILIYYFLHPTASYNVLICNMLFVLYHKGFKVFLIPKLNNVITNKITNVSNGNSHDRKRKIYVIIFIILIVTITKTMTTLHMFMKPLHPRCVIMLL